MDVGKFVPGSATNLMVPDRLSQPDVEDGFLLCEIQNIDPRIPFGA